MSDRPPPNGFEKNPPDTANRADMAASLLIAAVVFAAYYTALSDLRDHIGQFSKYPLASALYNAGKLDPARALDFSPLYLRICVILDARAADPFLWLVRLHSAFAGVACGMLFLAVRRRWGLAGGLAASAMLALYQGFLVYSYIFEPEPLLVMLIAALLLASSLTGRGAACISGVLAGLAILTRPSVWPFALAVGAALAVAAGRPWRLHRTALYAASLVAVLALLHLSPGPSGVSTTTMNPGTTFYDGANPLSFGVRAVYPGLVDAMSDDFPEESDYQHALYRMAAERSLGKEMTRGEVNSYWSGKALFYLIDEPMKAARDFSRKILSSLQNKRWHDLRSAFAADRRFSGTAPYLIPFAPIAALGLAGIFMLRKRWTENIPAYAGALSQLGVMTLIYASERQRMALLLFFCYFAGAAVAEIVKRRRSALAPVGCILVLTLIFSIESGFAKDDTKAMESLVESARLESLAAEARERGFPSEAVQNLARAVALSPWQYPFGKRPEKTPADEAGFYALALREQEEFLKEDGTFAFERAILLYNAGRLDEARESFERIKALDPSLARRINRVTEADYYLGMIAEKKGDKSRAQMHLKEALKRSPGSPEALAALYVLNGDPSPLDKLKRYFAETDAEYYVGMAALVLGKEDLAASRLERAARLLPEARDLKIHLAAALSGAGRHEEACLTYIEAMKARSATVMHEGPILRSFEAFTGSRPPDDFYRFLHGKALRQFGRLIEARRTLQEVYRASGRQVVADELAELEREMIFR